MDTSPGPNYTEFTDWAVSHGIEINGIAPARFPGHGLGMIATRTIQENETMLSVPANLMLTRDSIPEPFVSLFPADATNHTILVGFLVHGDSKVQPGLDIWRRVWPSWEDFEKSMPIFWAGWLRAPSSDSEPPAQDRNNIASSNSSNSKTRPKLSLLPPSISGLWNPTSDSFNTPTQTPHTNSECPYPHETRYQNLLPRQEKRLRDTYDAICSVFPATEWKDVAYNWAIINSRSFYYVSPGKNEPSDWNDAIGMVPLADFFNHKDDASCEVTFDGENYRFQAARRYAQPNSNQQYKTEKGEEIYMSYGSHSNDFLLVEYGFYLDDNPSDGVYLDDIILPELTRSEKKELAERECLGNFEITASGADSSTMAAASIMYMSRQRWREYVAGVSETGFDAGKTISIIRGWIEVYLRECTTTIASLVEMSKSEKEKDKVDLILARWEQIHRLCGRALKSTNE
ncbi:hypothetical protein BDW71DRAFT_208264 [Aspergillus fruticulosus]